MISPAYRAQVDLLLQILPHIAREDCFALKGGTAINMFVWNMPRLSVDVDLTYLPLVARAAALAEIAEGLRRIKERIETAIPRCKTTLVSQSNGQESQLACQTPGAQIKIEVNTTIRGYLFEPQEMDVIDAVEREFGRFVSMRVVALAELFGGKICAALDRQHPRDLFDVHQLFSNGGLTSDIRQGFIACLISSNRPIHEMLRPNFLDQRSAFEMQFAGMSREPFTYRDFEEARRRLLSEVHAGLTDHDRRFLLSFNRGEPDWNLSSHAKLKDLPAVQWKLSNIRSLKSRNQTKYAKQLRALEELI
jgi:predicted nucleotidyltransferase component of viral defense system